MKRFKHYGLKFFLKNKKNITCGVIYRQHNSPDRFQEYFNEIIERFSFTGNRFKMHRCNNANFSYFLNVSSRNHPHEGNLRLMTMVFSTVVNTIFLIATVLFNGMICLAVFKDKSLRTSSNALLVSLSIADLLTIVEFAGNIVLAHTGGAWCSYIAQYHYFVTSLTIVHLAAISLDRLLAIKWHLRYQSLVTNCRMVAAILFIWILLLLLNVLPILILSEDSHAEMDDFKKILTGCAETELRSEEHTSELQSRQYLVCRLLLEKKKTTIKTEINGYW